MFLPDRRLSLVFTGVVFFRVHEELVATLGEQLTLCNASRDPTGGFGLSSLLWWSVRMELQERFLSMDMIHVERGAAQLCCSDNASEHS